MPRTTHNYDNHSEYSESDTEMDCSPTSSSISQIVTPEVSGVFESEPSSRDHSKGDSNSCISHYSSGISSTTKSAFRDISAKQRTPDNHQSKSTDSDSPETCFIPVSPPSAPSFTARHYSRKLCFPPANEIQGRLFDGRPLPEYPCHGQMSVSPDRTPHYHGLSPVNDNDPSVYLRADTRIPFSNYFNNLVKLLHSAAAKGQLGKSHNCSNNDKTVFNFYWNTSSRDTEYSCNGETADEMQSTSSNFEKESPVKSESSCLRNTEAESSDDRMAMVSPSSWTNSSSNNNNNTASIEGSPILSGHFTQSPNFLKTSSPNMNHGSFLSPFPQYTSSPGLPGQHFPVPRAYPMMPHNPYAQLPEFRFPNSNTDKPNPVKKYKCDVCGKAFSRSNTLVTHKRIHTGAKPFKCEVCGRAFRQPGNLTRHRLTHTSIKPYVCPHCNKAFNRASNLNTHMRTHTSFQPFTCTWCGKGFSQKVDLKIHTYTHTGKKSHPHPH